MAELLSLPLTQAPKHIPDVVVEADYGVVRASDMIFLTTIPDPEIKN